MNVCPNDSTPLIFTFEQPGCEWHCMNCGRWTDFLSGAYVASDERLVRLHDHLVDRFKAGDRGPLGELEAPPAVDESPDHIKCDGCGDDSGRTKEQGKPSAWYQRSDANGTQTVCSRPCIALVAESTGKTKVVLPW